MVTSPEQLEKWKHLVQDIRAKVSDVTTINVASGQGGSDYWVGDQESPTKFTARLVSLKVKFEDDKFTGILIFDGGNSFPFVFPPNTLIL